MTAYETTVVFSTHLAVFKCSSIFIFYLISFNDRKKCITKGFCFSCFVEHMIRREMLKFPSDTKNQFLELQCYILYSTDIH